LERSACVILAASRDRHQGNGDGALLDEARFLEVRLKREENHVESALRESTAISDALVRWNPRHGTEFAIRHIPL
jgi:hypothetical protein